MPLRSIASNLQATTSQESSQTAVPRHSKPSANTLRAKREWLLAGQFLQGTVNRFLK